MHGTNDARRADYLREYQLYISESGSGVPAVVFESGLGEDLATWSNVQPQVALFARTMAYDGAGLGESNPSPHPKTVPEMAFELTLFASHQSFSIHMS